MKLMDGSEFTKKDWDEMFADIKPPQRIILLGKEAMDAWNKALGEY